MLYLNSKKKQESQAAVADVHGTNTADNRTALTLRQLRSILPSTKGLDMPSEIWIGGHKSEILCGTDFDDSHMDVYLNGFFTYTKHGYTSILRVDGFKRLCYDSLTNPKGYEVVPEEKYIDSPYFIALSVFGETQWQRNEDKRKAYEVALVVDCTADDNRWIEELSEPSFIEQREEKEREEDISKKLHAALDKLTGRQRQIVEMYFYQEMTQAEIAEVLGIRQQSVLDVLSAAVKRMRNHMGVL